MTSKADAPQRAIRMAIMALGGEGGGVLADWVTALAGANGFLAQLTSVPGVAQRTGATIYYIEMFPKGAAGANRNEPVLALMPFPGDVDIVVASELMEAARAVQRGFVTPDRTTLIASTNRVFAMTEKIAMGDGREDEAAMLAACAKAAKRLVAGDMSALAEANGSVISAVLFGALAGAQVLPFSKSSFEETIRRGGIGVAASLKAFNAGYEATCLGFPAVKPENALPAAVPGSALAKLMDEARADLPPAALAFALSGLERLVDYQDAAYARLYLDRLRAIHARDRTHGDGSFRLTAETARWLALGMSYEDTIRVAELKIRASRFERVRGEVGAKDGEVVEIAEFLHPRLQEIAESVPAGLGRFLQNFAPARRLVERLTNKGRVVTTTSVRGFLMLYAVASLKTRRRRSMRYAAEQTHLEEWLATLSAIAEKNYALAIEVAELRNLVKGYGDTHARGLANYRMILEALPPLVETRDGAATLAAWRQAALADETGEKLRATLGKS